jgi:hypothetical protein
MVEAIDTLAPKPSHVIIALVKQAAIRAVRLQIQRAGIKKYWHMTRAEISDLAKDYASHREELIAQAWEVVKRDRELWGYYVKEQRQLEKQREKARAELERKSQVMSNSRRPVAQGLPLNETHAQIEEAK